jgi:hypothetical protein
MLKALFFDLDGTLLTSGKAVSPSTLTALADMKKRGLLSPHMADALALTFYMPIFRHRELPGSRHEGFGAGYTPWSVDADSGYSWEPFGGNNPYDERVRF